MEIKNAGDSPLQRAGTDFDEGPNFDYPKLENLVWMTTEEAASYIRKSANALRIAVHKGHIHARKFRRRLYFKKSELDRMLDTSF